MSRPRKDPVKCANPPCQRAARARGLCTACYQYLERTGLMRPEGVIVVNGYRQLMRELSGG